MLSKNKGKSKCSCSKMFQYWNNNVIPLNSGIEISEYRNVCPRSRCEVLNQNDVILNLSNFMTVVQDGDDIWVGNFIVQLSQSCKLLEPS